MGGAVSTLPDVVDEDTARQLAGDKFDAVKFAELAVDGQITKKQFEQAATSFESEQEEMEVVLESDVQKRVSIDIKAEPEPDEDDAEPEEEYTVFTACLRKIGTNIGEMRKQRRAQEKKRKLVMELAGDDASAMPAIRHKVCVLVQTGVYNPVHMFHTRNFYLASQYCEDRFKTKVVGGLLSPTHETNARNKNKRNIQSSIPAPHRLAMCHLTVKESSWLAVDQWEITRRAHLDYLSVLKHCKEICEAQFPDCDFQMVYLCGEYNLVKSAPDALREMEVRVVTVGRCQEVASLKKCLNTGGGKQWKGVAHLVEDNSTLDKALDQLTSQKIRTKLTAMAKDGKKNDYRKEFRTLLGSEVSGYVEKHKLAEKMAGLAKWTDKDGQWRKHEQEYMAETERMEKEAASGGGDSGASGDNGAGGAGALSVTHRLANYS